MNSKEKTKHNYRSCFIVNVCIEDKIGITLQDSLKHEYFIDAKDIECINQFKEWFKGKFVKGIAQTCTILEYDIVAISQCETIMKVVKILNA